jgi:hypothetical protein
MGQATVQRSVFDAFFRLLRAQTQVQRSEGNVIVDTRVHDLIVGILKDDTQFAVNVAATSPFTQIAAGDHHTPLKSR